MIFTQKPHPMLRISAALFAAAGLSLAGPVPSRPLAGEPAGTGRYVETEISLPEGTDHLEDMRLLQDGTLRILARNMSTGEVTAWDTSDPGGEWNEAWQWTAREGEDTYYITSLSLAPDGGGAGMGMLFTETSEGSLEEIQNARLSFDAEGGLRVIPLEDEQIWSYDFSTDGSMVALSSRGTVVPMNQPDGKSQEPYSASVAEQIGFCQNHLYLLAEHGLEVYDLKSREPEGRDEALEQALFAGGQHYVDMSSTGHPIVFSEDPEGRLVFATNTGIYTHVPGGSVVEQIVDASLASFSDPAYTLIGVERIGETYVLACANGNVEPELLRFDFDPDMPVMPQHELVLYGLFQDDHLRQVITAFQKANPDVHVDYQVGVTGTDGITAGDALRTLNTEILAGNGPDLLLLDGMQVESYRKKGFLEDLRSIIEETEQEDGLLRPVAFTWEDARSGEICAVPTRFGLLAAVGKISALDPKLPLEEGLARIAESAGQTEDSLEEATVPWADAVMLPEILYYACASDWKREDGSFDREKLTAYVRVVKELYDAALSKEDADMQAQIAMMGSSLGDEIEHQNGFYGDLSYFTLEIPQKSNALILGVLSNMLSYATAEAGIAYAGAEGIRPMERDGKGLFLPAWNVGVLQNAREKETAEAFVRFLLSVKSSSANEYGLFPVNRTALDAYVHTDPMGENGAMSFSSENRETGERISLEVRWPSEAQQEQILDWIDTLGTCADTDLLILHMVTDEVHKCMEGTASAEETVEAILQKAGLYMAEAE